MHNSSNCRKFFTGQLINCTFMMGSQNCHTNYQCREYPFRDVNITRCCLLALMRCIVFFVICYKSEKRCQLHIIWTMQCILIGKSLWALCDIIAHKNAKTNFWMYRAKKLFISWYCFKVIIENHTLDYIKITTIYMNQENVLF